MMGVNGQMVGMGLFNPGMPNKRMGPSPEQFEILKRHKREMLSLGSSKSKKKYFLRGRFLNLSTRQMME